MNVLGSSKRFLPDARKVLLLGPLALALVLLSVVSGAQEASAQEVGLMVEVVEQVTGTPAGGTAAALAVTDPVLLDMAVETGPASYGAMTFGQAGSLQLGAETRMVISRQVVDAATGESDSLLSMLLGKVRLALSDVFRGLVEIDTPTATIGVKGTTLVVAVAPSGDTTVWVLEGEVEVTSKAGGRTLILTAGDSAVVSRGRPAAGPTPFDPESGVAAVRVLPPVLAEPSEQVPEDPPFGPDVDDLPPDRGDPQDPNDGFTNDGYFVGHGGGESSTANDPSPNEAASVTPETGPEPPPGASPR
ncbi:MAG: FecR domain-containing protein [Acidobacteriota bacterium]|nr:FecR domain-containing protein [Acidobacteriota bacterium]